MFRLVIVVNIFIQFVYTHPLNYGAHTPEFYNSLNPQQRYQRSFPGFYNNGMFQQQQLNPMFHSHPMEMNNRPLYRRNAYENNGFRPQFEPQAPIGMYGPSTMQQSKAMGGHDESRLIVLPRGADEEYAWNPLKTKMIEGFDEEDQDMMQEEEMGDALSYIDTQTPTRYTSERILKPPKHSAPSLHMEMAPPTTRMPIPPPSMGYGVSQPYGVQGMPQHHMMMPPHSENYQGNYQMQQFDPENMYPPQNYHHQHQKRYQPHHQYYQSSRYNNNNQFDNPHPYFETPNEEMMYPLPTKTKMHARTKIDSTPQEVIIVEDGDDDFYDDDEIVIEEDTFTLLSDTDNSVMTDDNSIDNVSSNTIEHESEEISESIKTPENIQPIDSNTTDQPEYDSNVDEQDDIEESTDNKEKDDNTSKSEN